MTSSNFPRVRRTAWRELRQDALAVYADNVVAQTKGKAEYDPIKKQLADLSNKNNTFLQCLADAVNRGKQAVAYKDVVKTEVLLALDAVARGLEDNANGSDMYIINAGMEVRQSPTKHTRELLPVTKLNAKSTGIGGQVLLHFSCPKHQRRQVETFAVEWSDDGGTTHHNGTYRNSQRILLEGLPSRKEVTVRVCCLGTRGRKSPWSEDTAGVFVL